MLKYERLQKIKQIKEQKIGLQKFLGGFRHFVPEEKPKLKQLSIPYRQLIGIDWNFGMEFKHPICIGQKVFQLLEPIKEKLKEETKYFIDQITHINLIPQEDIEFIFAEFCKNECKELTSIGRGEFGTLYSYKDYAIKIFFNGWHGRVDNDYEKLEKLQGIPLYPKLYAYYPNKFMIVEKINGITIDQYKRLENEEKFKIISKINMIKSMTKIQSYVKNTIDRDIYIHDSHDSNVMVTYEGELKIVDVGHFSISRNTHGIDRMNNTFLKLFNIVFPSETLLT